uniref:Cysteine-rich DPF motif domain-containing protein 1 n=1 Tax=Seriola lalandi dorsalis TaxID=1841481 RepID=A0A3B4X2J0_SERLL
MASHCRQEHCQLCGLTSPYTYYGQKPPNTRAIVLLEECFVTKDPFSPDKEKFLVLGSSCSLCNLCVCVGSCRLLGRGTISTR